jgi:5-oxoprolinase (ATP-hydrolysing) subunit A
MVTIDLNSDVGEGFGHWPLGDDAAMLEVITSANIACGYHAGDASTMRRVCELAAAREIAIGAQVGYRDLPGFGRRFIDIEPEALVNDVISQIAALDGFARVAGSRVRYVKPHGALYNAIVRHDAQAAAVVEAVVTYDASLPVLGLPGSKWLELAGAAGLTTVEEAFADRAYTPDGWLVSRREEGSVFQDADVIARRSVSIVVDNVVVDVAGGTVALRPASICVHGDTPGAVDIARRVRAALVDAGVTIAPFAAP